MLKENTKCVAAKLNMACDASIFKRTVVDRRIGKIVLNQEGGQSSRRLPQT